MHDAPYKVKPEVEKLSGKNVICIYGSDETDSLCPDLDARQFKIIKLSGGHHFGGDYQALAALILREAH